MSSSDDLYQNDGATYVEQDWYGTPPPDQVEEAKKQAGQIAASYPVIQNHIRALEEAIAKVDSIDNIQTQSVTVNGIKYKREVSIEGQILAQQLFKQFLETELNKYKDLKQDDDED